MMASSSSAAMQTPSRARQAIGDDALRQSIVKAFPSSLLDEQSSALDGLVSLLSVYSSSMTAEDLYYKTEAVLVSENRTTIDRGVVDQVRTALQAEWESKMRARSGAAQSKAYNTPAPKTKNALGSLFGVSNAQVTPTAQAFKASPTSNTIPSGARGAVIETLNPHLPAVESEGILDRSASTSRVALAIGTNPKAWNYRYMFERPGLKGQALDDAIEAATLNVLSTYSITDEELADPSVPTQESVYVVGRISPMLEREEKDGEAKERSSQLPKLTKGFVIEVSRRIGAGSRTIAHLATSLKVRDLTYDSKGVQHSSCLDGKLGLFPGMIAGFRGRNGAGDAFIVEEILMPTALPQAATSVEELQEHHHSSAKLNGEALQIFVAAGPYTLDNDLLFTPWHRLMDTIEKQTPDVVLFNGPFLPANHASLMDPSLAQMPQEIFEHHIAARLRALCERTARTTVILLPSIRDVVSPHVAWPQPMFDKASLNIHKRVKCLPNPCIFSINEIIFGTTTADVLRDLRAEELVVDIKSDKQSTQASSPDNMARTIRHLLHQRHFYPLFPASSASDLSLDVTHAHLAQFADVTPDVLITPSVLTPFAKVVDATVCVNPGQAAKGATDGRGSFATLKIVPMPQIKLQDELKRHHQSDSTDEVPRLPHVVYERARVDLLRL